MSQVILSSQTWLIVWLRIQNNGYHYLHQKWCHVKLYLQRCILLLLLLLLSYFSRVPLCTTPQTAAQQAPLSLGVSRQEHWSGLPFPSPVYESEKWKCSCSVVSDSLRPHGLQPTRLLHPWGFPGKSTGVGCHCLLLGTLLLRDISKYKDRAT